MKKIIIVIAFLTFFSSNYLFSQTDRKIGLSGSVQSSQFGISLPIWLGEKFVLAPALDFEYAEKIGTDFSIGLAPRFYFKKDKLSPYFGLKLGTLINIPSSDNTIDSKTKYDFIGGLAFGAEYFLGDNFSLGVEAQGNFTKSDKNSNRFGNSGGLNFNTATMIFATIYF
ncbi:MAG: hypothetical protein M0R21_04195 [Lentimicrobiaceae bacterium]|nr:hypothetical protein [Lentimicrobiaceae bacterium]